MASEDFINLQKSGDLVDENDVKEESLSPHSSNDGTTNSEENETIDSTTRPSGTNTHEDTSPPKENIVSGENSGQGKEDGEIEDDQFVQTMELDNDSAPELLILNDGFNLVNTVKEPEKIIGVGSELNNGNNSVIAQSDHNAVRNQDVDERPRSGVKRARTINIDQEPSVHVEYKSLTRASKLKLEELLQQWSQWHAQQKFSADDPNQTPESGEQTFFPALHFGIEKASTVSFWMDNQTSKEQNNFVPLDGNSVPMYDRGYALGLTSDDGSRNVDGVLKAVEASRCFNCGSYSHALRDCQKPRNAAAVDSARKQHNSKRNQTAGPRNPSRYYQDSPGGKYDGLKPGVIGSELRKLLGIGELDPPPWLHRMREMGYPPGYFEDEDQPSGIKIYADEETNDGEEDGEVLGAKSPAPKKRKTVEFPGINAPIPEKADRRRWESPPEASNLDSSRNRSHPSPYRSSEAIDRGHYSDPRRQRDYRDDGPPGGNLDSPRYNGYDQNYDSRGHPTPVLGRSLSDRGRWNPQVPGGSPIASPYSPVSFPSPSTLHSPQYYNSPHSESWAYGSQHTPNSDSSSRRNDRHDQHRHWRS